MRNKVMSTLRTDVVKEKEGNKMSGGRDWSIGSYGMNGRPSPQEETWSKKDAMETGLNSRKPL